MSYICIFHNARFKPQVVYFEKLTSFSICIFVKYFGYLLATLVYRLVGLITQLSWQQSKRWSMSKMESFLQLGYLLRLETTLGKVKVTRHVRRRVLFSSMTRYGCFLLLYSRHPVTGLFPLIVSREQRDHGQILTVPSKRIIS